MLNHFRTLLLNLSYAGDPAEHIPVGFSSRKLEDVFNNIHRTLFPTATSRLYKTFLAHSYLNVISAAGMSVDLLTFDKRISYSLDYSDYFKIFRHSNPVISAAEHPIFVYGHFMGNSTNEGFYDNYQISQVDMTQKIVVYSTVKEKYLSATQIFDSAEPDAEILLDFTEPVSAPVPIAGTGISFTIGGGPTFNDTADKTWEFLVEAPFIFDLGRTINEVSAAAVDALFEFKPEIDTKKFENLWRQHYNPVYRLAGLLLAYTTKLNSA